LIRGSILEMDGRVEPGHDETSFTASISGWTLRGSSTA